MTLRSIVAATDFSAASNSALRRALQLARAHHVSLCLLHAFDAGARDGSQTRQRVGDDTQRAAADAPADARLRQRLADLAASLSQPPGFEVGVHLRAGPPHQVIAGYVGTNAGALVVIASRAEPDVSGLGSTALKVVRQPTCPVLVVRAGADHAYGKVLSAVDLRDGSVRAASLAVELFPDAHHQLLYALDSAAGGGAADDVDGERLRGRLESSHQQADRDLQLLAQRLSTGTRRPVSAAVADDVPARAILVGAADLAADCVVVGHHGHGPATESYLGSIAQHVIYAALGDVLVVP